MVFCVIYQRRTPSLHGLRVDGDAVFLAEIGEVFHEQGDALGFSPFPSTSCGGEVFNGLENLEPVSRLVFLLRNAKKLASVIN